MGVCSLFDWGFGFLNRLRSELCFLLGTKIGRTCGFAGLGFFLSLVDRSDHVKSALWKVLEFVIQDALAAVERVLQTDILSLDAAELLGREKRLGQESLQPARRGRRCFGHPEIIAPSRAWR